MGIFMESICHYRDCESFFLFCYSICIHARQFYNSLGPNCYRIYMLLGCFDSATTYSSTSALMSTVGYLEDTLLGPLSLLQNFNTMVEDLRTRISASVVLLIIIMD